MDLRQAHFALLDRHFRASRAEQSHHHRLNHERSRLGEVNLAGREKAWPKELSGGEAQRVALARALVSEPELVLLHEPFAALDTITRLRMHDLVRDLRHRHHASMLLVTHDVDEAIALADRIVVMNNGRLGDAHTVN